MSWSLAGEVAVVTGAAGGIGRAAAQEFARRGCHLALVDRNAAGLGDTADLVRRSGVTVTEHAMDVADAAAVARLPGQVVGAHGRASVLLNNAGVALVGRFDELTMDEYRWLVEVNFLGVVATTRALLPVLQAQPRAQIANVSSVYGIIAPAGQTAYAASKFAVRGFSESLRHELRGTSVGVTVVHPGGIRTAIATGARVAAAADPVAAAEQTRRYTDAFLRTPPERAGAAIVRAIERRQPRLLIGTDARLAALLQRLLPVRYWEVIRLKYREFL